MSENDQKELERLKKLLKDNNIWKQPTVLYHRPQEAPHFQETHSAHTANLQASITTHLQTQKQDEQAFYLKAKQTFIKQYKKWSQAVTRIEINDDNPFTDGLRPDDHYHQQQKWRSSLATFIPSQLLPGEGKRATFIDTNGHFQGAPVTCPLSSKVSYSSDDGNHTVAFTVNTTVWTHEEVDSFKKAYLESPKDFHQIASKLALKSCCQCVQFYYLNKKRLGLKQAVKDALLEKRAASAAASAASVSSAGGSRGGGGRGRGRPPKNNREDSREEFMQVDDRDDNGSSENTAVDEKY